MTRSVFKIGKHWINLAFVQHFELWPARDWGDEDEKRDRLMIFIMPNAGVEITEKVAQADGYKDIPALIEAITAAMDEYVIHTNGLDEGLPNGKRLTNDLVEGGW